MTENLFHKIDMESARAGRPEYDEAVRHITSTFGSVLAELVGVLVTPAAKNDLEHRLEVVEHRLDVLDQTEPEQGHKVTRYLLVELNFPEEGFQEGFASQAKHDIEEAVFTGDLAILGISVTEAHYGDFVGTE
jgi:hypothetical protein